MKWASNDIDAGGVPGRARTLRIGCVVDRHAVLVAQSGRRRATIHFRTGGNGDVIAVKSDSLHNPLTRLESAPRQADARFDN